MIRENAKTLKIKEQFIDDPVTGLLLMFRVTPNGEARLQLRGDKLPYGNRDFQFDGNGNLVGTGTGTCNKCFPTKNTDYTEESK